MAEITFIVLLSYSVDRFAWVSDSWTGTLREDLSRDLAQKTLTHITEFYESRVYISSMSSDKQAMDKGLSALCKSIRGEGDYVKFVKIERGLDKIAMSILGVSIIGGSMLLLSSSNIELNKFEIEKSRQKIDFKPSTNFFARNYVFVAYSVVISLSTLCFVADLVIK